MLEGVTIEQLRTLAAVAEAGSFSAAARKLGRVQAAVSQSIERLETQLGLRLFDRSGRVPVLTQQGEAVVAAATAVHGGLDALDELVANLKRGAETRLSIAVDVLFPTSSLIGFVKEFAREHPAVELTLYTDVLSAVTAHVREKRSTFGVAIEDADFGGLDRRPIAEVRLLPVAASFHALAMHAPPLGPASLAEAVQIVLSEHHQEGDRATSDHGVFSTRTWRVVDLATKQALIENGLGWGHLPEHLVREQLRAGVLVELPLEPWGGVAPRRALILVWRPSAVVGPVAKWAQGRLSELCQQAVAAQGPASHTV
ncbi:MAG TPA: LysR family transcriptional regulator [Polyangiaceae bacterium]|jgi:DNA-binding transcriptional LysR family regulator|nr:LysR family transcriptional regulator [Polyangiaceae bacterium]